jgi:hypothetical protein
VLSSKAGLSSPGSSVHREALRQTVVGGGAGAGEGVASLRSVSGGDKGDLEGLVTMATPLSPPLHRWPSTPVCWVWVPGHLGPVDHNNGASVNRDSNCQPQPPTTQFVGTHTHTHTHTHTLTHTNTHTHIPHRAHKHADKYKYKPDSCVCWFDLTLDKDTIFDTY